MVTGDHSMRITIDHDLCIGSATCASDAPSVFRLDDNGQAAVIENAWASAQVLIDAASNCPSEAISLDLGDPSPASGIAGPWTGDANVRPLEGPARYPPPSRGRPLTTPSGVIRLMVRTCDAA